MSTVADKTDYTIEDLLAMPDHKNFELVDGQLVEVNVSNLSSFVATKICTRLDLHCTAHQLGAVFGADAYYECFPARPRHARKPDASFIRKERLPVDWLEQGYFRIAPDLAVEVVSPGDLAYEVDKRIAEYLEADVQLVWQINPEERLVFVHRGDRPILKLKENDSLDGEDVVPGFSCRIGDLFPPRAAAPG
ncbi:MAG: Uma2 family endonuclease [Gemmataceae bacterium]|nr:Uma2 family endonuclease [Gemmataceae bacterium]